MTRKATPALYRFHDGSAALDDVWHLVNNALTGLDTEGLSEEQAKIIYDAYNASSRTYHDVEHLMDMTRVSEQDLTRFRTEAGISGKIFNKYRSMISVADFFHDCVYAHVDGGVTPAIEKIISPYLEPVEGTESHKWRVKSPVNDPLIAKLLRLFDMKEGQELDPTKGQNEFMSAVVAASMLRERGMEEHYILAVCTLIEATIPFRTQKEFEQLAHRLADVAGKDVNDSGIKNIMKSAVFVANRDVYGFAGYELENQYDSFIAFLKGTWKLIPEFSPALRGTEYSISEYRQALNSRIMFGKILKGEAPYIPAPMRIKDIFHSYDGYPPPEKMAELQERSKASVETAELYLKSKYVSASFFEAIARLLDIKEPTNMVDFVSNVGDLIEKNISQNEITNGAPKFRPQNVTRKSGDLSETDLAWLALKDRGDQHASGFDVPRSAAGCYILETIGAHGVKELFNSISKLNSDIDKLESPKQKKEASKEIFSTLTKSIGAEAMQVLLTALQEKFTKSHPLRSGKLAVLKTEGIANALSPVASLT